ncbi:MAG: ribose 5-phosphate isomerase A [Desulfurococcales archaeon]|nr:ribose 5-phosphate isomerase A [Desulfurococcales archaeon]
MGEQGKREAAKGVVEEFADLIHKSRVIGIGTGSTIANVVKILYENGMLDGKILVPSSYQAMELLSLRGLPVHTNFGGLTIDLYIDGADEVSLRGDMIKGRGAAILGEKMLAYASRINIFVVDEGKMVNKLGSRKPLPLEVHPWIYNLVIELLHKRFGWNVQVRKSSSKDGPTISDHGNIVLDAYTGPLEDPYYTERELSSVPGILCTGLFLGMANHIVVGFDDGGYRVYNFERRFGLGYT